jgi:acyl dehydratase
VSIDPVELLARRETNRAVNYRDQDVMLYALAVGLGRDPDDPAERAYVYEGAGLKVVPSFASLLAHSPLLDDCGWDFSRMLHLEERLRLHRPLMDWGRLLLDSRVSGLRDMGPGRGALIELELQARDAADGRPVFTVIRSLLARADGGFDGPRKALRDAHHPPRREPDLTCSLATRPDQALLYRLSGDRNPLHADPAAAEEAGLGRPILHGLCTWGIACRAILRTICEYDSTLIRALQGRFARPVYPGETLLTEMWQAANIVSFRVRAVERDAVVLSHGRCELAT